MRCLPLFKPSRLLPCKIRFKKNFSYNYEGHYSALMSISNALKLSNTILQSFRCFVWDESPPFSKSIDPVGNYQGKYLPFNFRYVMFCTWTYLLHTERLLDSDVKTLSRVFSYSNSGRGCIKMPVCLKAPCSITHKAFLANRNDFTF